MAADDHLDGRDVDAEFAAIIAGWADVPDLPGADEEAAPAAPAAETTETTALPAALPVPVAEVPVAPRESAVPPPGIVEASLEEGHFEPEPVELPPQEDLHFWGIVIGLTIGPILLLWMTFFGEGHSRWWLYSAFGLLIGGFALLVMRQPRHRDDDDRDNGARV